jgi:hypothetical protein
VCNLRGAIASILVITALALSACGGDEAKPSATAGPIASGGATPNAATANSAPTDVCTLVTRAEASAALNATVTDKAATVPPVKQEVATGLAAYISACQYTVASTGGLVQIELREAKGEADKIKEFTQAKCADKEEIPGLGDFACWFSAGHRELLFAKGGAYVDLNGGALTDDAVRSLAEKAISRLP